MKSVKRTVSQIIKSDIPDSFDWRDKGIVNPVKNQGSCGSCWVFSAIATSESAYAIATGKLIQFSEQNLVDCAIKWLGCSGGWPSNSFNYVIEIQNGHFNSLSLYSC